MAHPRMYDDSNPVIKCLREVCLALPEAFEKEAWGECTFRVTGGSMFAMTDNNHHNSGHLAVWIKAPPMVQEILVKSDRRRFFVPPYMGPEGWVGVRLDDQLGRGRGNSEGRLPDVGAEKARRAPTISDGTGRKHVRYRHKTTLNVAFENDARTETGHAFRDQVSIEED